jgi:hypothetical protein
MCHIADVCMVQENYAGQDTIHCVYLLNEHGHFIAGFNFATTGFTHDFPNPERIGMRVPDEIPAGDIPMQVAV